MASKTKKHLPQKKTCLSRIYLGKTHILVEGKDLDPQVPRAYYYTPRSVERYDDGYVLYFFNNLKTRKLPYSHVFIEDENEGVYNGEYA
jgi:hypothetical protein